MSVKEDEISKLISEFARIEELIKATKETDSKESIYEKEKDIITAYNNIVRYVLPIWSSDNEELRTRIKQKLIDVFYRLKNNLTILKFETILPQTLDVEIKIDEHKASQATKEEIKEEILQSKLIYDREIFNALLDEFDIWDKKITRKNASEKEDVIELRTRKIIDAYNKLVEFAKPILDANTEQATKEIRDALSTRKEYITDDLKILNANNTVPNSLTEKIKTEEEEDNNKSTDVNQKTNDSKGESKTSNQTNDNNEQMSENKNNKETKPEAKMTMTTNEYYKMCNQQLNYTYTGEPLGLPPFIDAIK